MMNIVFAGIRHSHVFCVKQWIDSMPDMRVAGVWENNPELLPAAREYGLVPTCESYEELLSLPSDIVIMGDCYGRRGEETAAALRMGKHVFSDKPVCTSLDALSEIEELTVNNHLSLGALLDLRMTSAALAARDAVSCGLLGKIHNISFGGQHPLEYGARPKWYFEKGMHGGTVNDIAIHGIDLVYFITGKRLEKICSVRAWNAFAKAEPDFKDCANVMAVLSGGTGLLADVSYSMPYPMSYTPPQCWRFTMWGEKGILEFDCSNDYAVFYGKECPAPQRLTHPPAKSNLFADFLSEINGSPAGLTTREVISASRDCLTLQSMASEF